MGLGMGKLVEDIRFQLAGHPQAITTTAVYFNGTTTTGAGTAIDTQPYDEVVFVLAAGDIGAAGSMSAAIYHSNDDNADNAVAVTGANFTTFTQTNQRTAQQGYIKCKNYRRYMYIRHVCANATSVQVAGGAILGRADTMPVGNSPVFDLNW